MLYINIHIHTPSNPRHNETKIDPGVSGPDGADGSALDEVRQKKKARVFHAADNFTHTHTHT